ncbi:MAG: hypothetical protein DI554_00140 [Sphingobium sp.]|nr:MAG: hypothetical protein DI554_00140 [Sphingobium sp.]
MLCAEAMHQGDVLGLARHGAKRPPIGTPDIYFFDLQSLFLANGGISSFSEGTMAHCTRRDGKMVPASIQAGMRVWPSTLAIRIVDQNIPRDGGLMPFGLIC